MQKIIGVTELQRRFRSVFDDVTNNHTPYVLTRGSRPEAVMIPYEDFTRYQALDEQGILHRFDLLMERMASYNAAVGDEEVEVDVQAALDEVRSQRE